MAIKNGIKDFAKRPVLLVLLLILILEFAYLIRFNFIYSPMAMDQDAAKLMTHMVEIVRTGRLLIPDWRYMTTHEIDSAMLLAIPFYKITEDVYFAFSMSNTIYMFVLLAVILALLKNCGVKKEISLLVCCFIYVPYSYGMLDYMNMLFLRGAQYSIKILIPLLAILLITFPKKNIMRDIVLSTVWFFLVFLSAFSSGLFPFVTGIFPIAGAYIVDGVFRNDRSNEINIFRTLVLGIGTVLSFAGFALHQHFDISPSGMDAMLTYSEEFGERIFVNLGYFFNLFNALPSKYYGDHSIMTMEGIGYILRFFLAVFLIVCSIRYVICFFTGKENISANTKTSAATRYMAAMIIVNVLIHLLSSYDSSRYYLIETFCMFILAGIFLSGITVNLSGKTWSILWICLCLLVCGIWYSSKKYIETCMVIKNTYGYCYGISDFLDEQNVDNVIILDNTEVDEICRLLLPDTRVSNYNSVDDMFISYDWYIGTGERSYYGDTSIIVSQYYDDLTPVFGVDIASKYRFIGQVNGFNLFRAEEFCLPVE